MTQVPPPLPATRPVRCARFGAHQSGVFSVERDRGMIEDAQAQALAWIEQHPEAEIISIDTACGRLLTVVTIWYR